MASISQLYEEVFGEADVKSKKTMKDQLLAFYEAQATEMFNAERKAYEKKERKLEKDPEYFSSDLQRLYDKSLELEKELLKIDKEIAKLEDLRAPVRKRKLGSPPKEGEMPEHLAEKIATIKRLYKKERDDE